MNGSNVEGGSGFRVTLDGSSESFDVCMGESILNGARRAGYWLPFECGWGSCGRCRATLVDGEVTSMFPEAPAIDARDARRKRILLCQSTPASDVVVKPLRVDHEPPVERPVVDVVATLMDRREIGPEIVELSFALSDGDGAPVTATFRPGQYAVLELAAGLRRCYSMSNLPGTDRVEFIIKRYPGKPGSTSAFELQPGADIPMELPYGDMWLRDHNRPAILIAGGTGISAMLSLVRSMAQDPTWAERHVHVLYGAATRDELVCWEELEEHTSAIPRTHLHGALVNPGEDWTGTHGLITETLRVLLDIEDEREDDPRAATVYLAGPPPMVKAVQDVLSAYGIQLDRIHMDSFG